MLINPTFNPKCNLSFTISLIYISSPWQRWKSDAITGVIHVRDVNKDSSLKAKARTKDQTKDDIPAQIQTVWAKAFNCTQYTCHRVIVCLAFLYVTGDGVSAKAAIGE